MTPECADVCHRLLFDPDRKQMIPFRATSDNLILVAFHYFWHQRLTISLSKMMNTIKRFTVLGFCLTNTRPNAMLSLLIVTFASRGVVSTLAANFVAVFPAFFFFCMIIACSDDERNPITPAVHIVAGTVDVPVEGQGEILLLTADAAVTVSSDASWCVISEKAEKGISYYATMAANVETTPREAKVTIKSDNIALGRVLVKQKPKTAGEPEIPSGSMESDAKTLAAKIYAGVNIGNTLEATGGETAWGNPRISEA